MSFREIFQPLLFLLARSTEEELGKKIEFLKAENEMLRKRVPKKHIVLRQNEKEKLMGSSGELVVELKIFGQVFFVRLLHFLGGAIALLI